ncbi:hypothetical protein OC846_003793 [Tilletia horrida]|uniref:Uncharacterized protein n=1 Tax=Tilletia horrida TaxID=155126 RepID=A0AAN6JTI1_9BASI|nr:hypothetical protein OC846_003793 [Tilletia horrida]
MQAHSRFHSLQTSAIFEDAVISPLLSSLEREDILSLPRRTLSLRRKPSSSSILSKSKGNDFSPDSFRNSWVRRMSDAFSIPRRGSAASLDSRKHRSSPPDLGVSDIEARPAFDENDRPCLNSAPSPLSQPRLRRQASDESFQCRGVPSFDLSAFCSSKYQEKACDLDDQGPILYNRASFSSLSTASEASGSSLTSVSDCTMPITPCSIERPLRPKTRPPSLMLNEDEISAIEDMTKEGGFGALGIFDCNQNSTSAFLSAPLPVSRRAASCDGRCLDESLFKTRHTPRLNDPSLAVADISVSVRFVGLPSDGTTTATSQFPLVQASSPTVTNVQLNPVETVQELKERLADMVLDRFGVGVSATELTVSMHSMLPPIQPLTPSGLDSSVSPTIKLPSGPTSDAGTATPSMTAAWSSTASLPSLLPVPQLKTKSLPVTSSTVVTELRHESSTLWSEGIEDGFTLVARIRSLAFF